MGKTYPYASDIKGHKDALWAAMLQYFKGVVPMQNVEMSFKHLFCDALLHARNHLNAPLNAKESKRIFQIVGIFDAMDKMCKAVFEKP